MIPRLLVTFFVALIALALAAPAVLGHAELEETDPPDGGSISTPYTLSGTFSEPLVGNSRVVIRNATGEEVASALVTDAEDPSVLTVDLPALPAGEYVARWTATTEDGHTERYSTSFTVVDAATAPPTASPTDAPTVAPATAATSAPTSPTPAPTAAATVGPTASPAPVDPSTPTSGNDLLIALLVAGVAVAGVLGYLFLRNRR